jgi:hypothetical protein
MLPAGLEPPMPASESPQTHALDRAATWTSKYINCLGLNHKTEKHTCDCTEYFSAYRIQRKEKYVTKAAEKQTPAFYKVNNELLCVTHEY